MVFILICWSRRRGCIFNRILHLIYDAFKTVFLNGRKSFFCCKKWSWGPNFKISKGSSIFPLIISFDVRKCWLALIKIVAHILEIILVKWKFFTCLFYFADKIFFIISKYIINCYQRLFFFINFMQPN